MTQWRILPHMGQPLGICEPINNDHLFPDPPVPLPISLVVTRHRESTRTNANHWTLIWVVGWTEGGWGRKVPVHRRVHVVREDGQDHLTNWGPVTQTAEMSENCVKIPVTTLTLSERKELEKIAENTDVYAPNGVWTGQDWVCMVLEGAVQHGLLSNKEADEAVGAARRVKPSNMSA